VRTKLTDRTIISYKPAAPGKRNVHADALVPGLALRVTDKGHKSFVLIARYPQHPKNPSPRALGSYGAITLEQARDKARAWLAMIDKGVDPEVEAARQKAAARQIQANTFSAVAEQFLERHCAKLAKRAEAERIIRRDFIKRWGPRPVTDIQPQEVSEAVCAIVRRGKKYEAHNAFGHLRRLYSWAIGTGEFGVTTSPLERLRPVELIGAREARDRVLKDHELRAIWSSTTTELPTRTTARNGDDDKKELGYPYGPVFRMLILTGQRLSEVAGMRWSEVDKGKRLWTIPAARMKGDRAHEVPLTAEALAVLDALPRFTGDCVFTTTGGVKSVNGFGKAKERLDALSGVTGWRLHDLRRTARTHFSALPVPDNVRELVIAHAQKGLHKVYDLHSYQTEKRECLELWENRLLGIVEPKPSGDGEPTPADVTDLNKVRAERAAHAGAA
jgi:integrase